MVPELRAPEARVKLSVVSFTTRKFETEAPFQETEMVPRKLSPVTVKVLVAPTVLMLPETISGEGIFRTTTWSVSSSIAKVKYLLWYLELSSGTISALASQGAAILIAVSIAQPEASVVATE
jgi:hypothetical protein